MYELFINSICLVNIIHQWYSQEIYPETEAVFEAAGKTDTDVSATEARRNCEAEVKQSLHTTRHYHINVSKLRSSHFAAPHAEMSHS